MDPDRARELLAAERARIGRALARLGREDTGEETDDIYPANQASELYQDELDEGLSDHLGEDLGDDELPGRGYGAPGGVHREQHICRRGAAARLRRRSRPRRCDVVLPADAPGRDARLARDRAERLRAARRLLVRQPDDAPAAKRR